MDKNKIPPWKWVLAGAGVITIVVGGGYALWNLAARPAASAGPSELTLYPERQDEILAARRAEGVAERLNLSPEQQQKLTVIMAEFMASRDAERDQHQGNVLARLQARRAAMQAMDGKMQKLLSPEQAEKYATLKSEMFGRIVQLQQLRPLLGSGLPLPPNGLLDQLAPNAAQGKLTP